MMKHTVWYLLTGRGGINQRRFYHLIPGAFALLILPWGAFYADAPGVAVGNISSGQNAESRQSVGRNSASGENQRSTLQPENLLSAEELKMAIIAKNIFRPTKLISPLASENVPAGLGPRPLRNSFTLLGIRETEKGRRADLAFKNPTPRVEEVAVGHVLEDVLTIVAIEPTFIRCKIFGSEVRLSVNESSTDAWVRLSGNMINYILLGTVATDAGPVAHIKVIGEEAYRTVEVGDMLGDATIIIIEEGHVLLIDGEGNEISIRVPLLSPRS